MATMRLEFLSAEQLPFTGEVRAVMPLANEGI